ncbi:hypothetical protein [Nonomuraea sp. NPDC049625]|uniref:hypothetical protein n=1 Tax=Nonomuraea sp. NPDC049625 TaxID=3155775 RepID=UPI0034412140
MSVETLISGTAGRRRNPRESRAGPPREISPRRISAQAYDGRKFNGRFTRGWNSPSRQFGEVVRIVGVVVYTERGNRCFPHISKINAKALSGNKPAYRNMANYSF